jgi:hypothetical protein
MHATRAAVEEGVLPGGGGALLRATEHLKKVRKTTTGRPASPLRIDCETLNRSRYWPARASKQPPSGGLRISVRFGGELRFEYVVKKARQLVVFEGEVDTCHKEDDSHPETRPS